MISGYKLTLTTFKSRPVEVNSPLSFVKRKPNIAMTLISVYVDHV